MLCRWAPCVIALAPAAAWGANPPSVEALVTGIGRPSAVVAGPGGAIYVGAPEVHRVFKTDSIGRMTVAAGNTTSAFATQQATPTGAGWAAGRSSLWAPVALALDGRGNLYITDDGNRAVRRIAVSTGIISTVFGPPSPGEDRALVGASTEVPRTDDPRHPVITRPAGLAVDAAARLYVVDSATHAVLRVNLAAGGTETIAGSGLPGYAGDGGPAAQARLSSPAGIALDRKGNLYVADRGNHCVRRVDARRGVITTLAGNGAPGASGDGKQASMAQLRDPVAVAVGRNGDLFIADLGNARIRRVDGRTGVISTPKGLDSVAATAIAVAEDGALLVADGGKGTVFRRSRTGETRTIAGNGRVGYTGDGGPATESFLSAPASLARDSAGRLYVSELTGHRVRRIDSKSGVISTVAGTGQAGYSGDGSRAAAARLNHPTGIGLHPDGSLLIADTDNHRVRRVGLDGTIATLVGTGQDGIPEDGAAAREANIGRPTAVAVDHDGSLVVIQGRYGIILRIDAAGRVRTIVGSRQAATLQDGQPATSGRVGRIAAFALGPGGDILFADEGSLRVWRVDGPSGVARIVAGRGAGGSGEPADPAFRVLLGDVLSLAFDPAGNAYAGTTSPPGLWRVDAATHQVAAVQAAGKPIRPTALLCVDPDTLYFSDWSEVWRQSPAGERVRVAGGGFGF